MAKSILRSRAGAKKLLMLKSHLQAVSLRLTTLKTTQSMAMVRPCLISNHRLLPFLPYFSLARPIFISLPISISTHSEDSIPFHAIHFSCTLPDSQAMRSATKAMTVMSQKLNMPQLQRLVMDFERTNEKMDMTQDIMGDALDDAFGVRKSSRARRV